MFLNGVAGLGTPYLQPLFESRFIGEGAAEDKCVAVCESIVFLIQVNLEEMTRIAGPLSAIVISGGLAELDGLCQRLSDLSGLPLQRPNDHEASTRGLINLLDGNLSTTKAQRAGTGFQPRSDPELRARYHAWREALEAALVKENGRIV